MLESISPRGSSYVGFPRVQYGLIIVIGIFTLRRWKTSDHMGTQSPDVFTYM